MMMLSLRNFTYRIGQTRILQDINLDLDRQEIVCLLGPNGAGKSSLLKVLSSPVPLYEGDFFFEQKKLTNPPAHQAFLQKCAYIGHEPGLFYDLSVEENLNFFLRIFVKKINQEDKQRADFLLECAQLHDQRKKRVRLLSRGFKQRLGLVRCFVHQPKLLFMDEPLTALDQQGLLFFEQLLKQARKQGCLALVTSHEEAFFRDRNIATRFLFLKQGHLVADISKDHYSQIAQKKARELLYNQSSSEEGT